MTHTEYPTVKSIIQCSLSAFVLVFTVASEIFAQDTVEWIVVGDDGAGVMQSNFAGQTSLTSGEPVLEVRESNNNLSVVRIEEGVLPQAQVLMHDTFHRCGGYTVHDSLESAIAEVNNPVYAPDYVPPQAIFAPVIDQHAAVNEALDAIDPSAIVGTIVTLSDLGTRHFESEGGEQAAQVVFDSWIQLAQSRSDIEIERIDHSWRQDSVSARIIGSEIPDEVIVLGAHLDSINLSNSNNAPGADDDASGVAVVTEVLRVLMEIDFRPRRSIHFFAYAAEEVGLRGSGDIAGKYAQDGINVISALQIDMSGFNGSTRDLYFVKDYVSAELTSQLMALIAEYNTTDPHRISVGETQCGYACSDHGSWTRFGFPSAFPFETKFSEYNRSIHSPADLLENMDASGEKQAKFAKLAVEYVIEFAKHSRTAG